MALSKSLSSLKVYFRAVPLVCIVSYNALALSLHLLIIYRSILVLSLKRDVIEKLNLCAHIHSTVQYKTFNN